MARWLEGRKYNNSTTGTFQLQNIDSLLSVSLPRSASVFCAITSSTAHISLAWQNACGITLIMSCRDSQSDYCLLPPSVGANIPLDFVFWNLNHDILLPRSDLTPWIAFSAYLSQACCILSLCTKSGLWQCCVGGWCGSVPPVSSYYNSGTDAENSGSNTAGLCGTGEFSEDSIQKSPFREVEAASLDVRRLLIHETALPCSSIWLSIICCLC